MQAIVYTGHGSRVEEARRQASRFMEQSMKHHLAPIQELSFLELSTPTIEDGVKRCIQRGATKIAVVPVLLLSAMHAKKDIPAVLDTLQSRYPHIPITYGRPFGVHSKIVEILMNRILDQRPVIMKDAIVLLVGRGSSDPGVKQDLNEIATQLHQLLPFTNVKTCYLAAAKPSFEEGLESAKSNEHQQVFVVPYLLFTGILMKRLEMMIGKLGTSNQDVVLCKYLGYHPKLQDVVYERTAEAIRAGIPKKLIYKNKAMLEGKLYGEFAGERKCGREHTV